MPAERYTSTGQGTPHIVALDRNRTRHTGAQFERPTGELSLPMGTLLLGSVLGIIAAFVLVLGVL